MTITKSKNGEQLTVSVEGRLDTTTAPQFEKFLGENTDGTKVLTIDLEKLEYISSAGLRVLLSTHKKMSKVGTMKVINVSDEVMEVFDMTGFAEILDIG